MKNISAAEAREHFAELVNQVGYGKESIAISRHGKCVAALVPLEVATLFEKLENEQDIKDALEAKNELNTLGGINWEDIK